MNIVAGKAVCIQGKIGTKITSRHLKCNYGERNIKVTIQYHPWDE